MGESACDGNLGTQPTMSQVHSMKVVAGARSQTDRYRTTIGIGLTINSTPKRQQLQRRQGLEPPAFANRIFNLL